MPHRVLVVDDEEAIRTLVKDYLEEQGLLVSCASDGEEGIKVFRTVRPHLVLIDFLLPRKNGFAVAEAIRRDTSNAQTPIIMMSGVFKNPKTAVEAREKYRVVEFLAKPLDMGRLKSLIDDSLAGVEPEPEPPPPLPAPQPQRPAARVDAEATIEAPSERAAPDEDDGLPPRGLSYYGRSSGSSGRGSSSGGSSAASSGSRRIPPALATDEGGSPMRAAAPGADGELFSGRPFPALAEEGEIERTPVALVLSTIGYEGVTGMLDLTDQGTHRRIYFVRGLPTFMQSNAEGENVGALLLRRGRITEPDFQRCLEYMKSKGRTLQQSLLELRLANEHELSTAYKLLAGQLLPIALGMASGKFKWRETDAFVGRVPEGNFEAVQILFEGIKRHVHPPQILKFFKGREDVPLMKTTQFDKLMPFFRRAFSANNIAHEIGGKITYREMTRKHASQVATVIPQLFALVTSGMTVLPEVDEDNAMEIAVNVAAAAIVGMNENQALEETDAPLELSDGDDVRAPEEKRARAAVLRYYDDIMSRNFFQVFGVERDTEPERIKAAYFELAKRWHADSYADVKLGDARPKLDAIFQRITEAYETITDKAKREEYIVYLDRQSKGLPTDVNQILRGEQLFDQAQAMIRRRDWNGAKPVLEEAIQMNPGDALYYANLGWVTYNLNPRSQQHLTDAVQSLKRAVQEQENCPIAYQYLGQIAFARGQVLEAKRWWQKCIEWEPNNIEASRGLRMLNSREDKDRSSKSGLLGKFLKK